MSESRKILLAFVVLAVGLYFAGKLPSGVGQYVAYAASIIMPVLFLILGAKSGKSKGG